MEKYNFQYIPAIDYKFNKISAQKTNLDKFGTVTGKAALEPQKRDNITHPVTLFHNGRHWHTSIAWLLTCRL